MTTLDPARIAEICERLVSGMPHIGFLNGGDAYGQRADGDSVIATLPSPDTRNSAVRALHLHGYQTADLDLAYPEALSAVRITGWSPRRLDRRIRDLALAVDQLERTFPTTITTAVGAYIGLCRDLGTSAAEYAPAAACRAELQYQIEQAVGPIISSHRSLGDVPEEVRARLERSDALTKRVASLLDQHLGYARKAIRQLATRMPGEPTLSAREQVVAEMCTAAEDRLRAERFFTACHWAEEHLPAGDVVPFAVWCVAEYGLFQLNAPAYPEVASRWDAVQSDAPAQGLSPDPDETRRGRPRDDLRADQGSGERNAAVVHAAVDFPAAPTADGPIAPETADRPELPGSGAQPSRGSPR